MTTESPALKGGEEVRNIRKATVGLLSDMLGLAVVVLVAMLLILAIEGIKLTSDALRRRRRMRGEIEE